MDKQNASPPARSSPDTVPFTGGVGRAAHLRQMGQHGIAVLLTGLSGAGKSTVAAACERMLAARGYKTYLLDGDNTRRGLCSDLGFSEADRAENIRRLAECAALMADAGMIVLLSAIAPQRPMRAFMRERVETTCGRGYFAEVYVDTPLEACAARDVKGLYKRAMAGEIADFTGVSSPYEVPEAPDLRLPCGELSVDEAAARLCELILCRQSEPNAVLERCAQAAVEAGGLIMDIYADPASWQVEQKSDGSPLTRADLAADAHIRRALARDFPQAFVLSEESYDPADTSRLDCEYCFSVDPLDGTKEFLQRNGEFTVNIALTRDGAPIAGVVYIPARRMLYAGAAGLGAWKMEVDLTSRGVGDAAPCGDLFAKTNQIHVSQRTSNLIAMRSRSHLDERTSALYAAGEASGRIAEVRIAGSSIKGCMIADGGADVYYRCGRTCEWDTAAMQAVVEAAGGFVRGGDGVCGSEAAAKLRYNKPEPYNERGFYMVNDAGNEL